MSRLFWSVAVVVLIFCSSCVPAEIKRQIDLVDVIIQTAVQETQGVEDLESDVEARQQAMRAVNAVRRAAPHTDNLKRWIEGEEAADGN
jgi:hypothetical protein